MKLNFFMSGGVQGELDFYYFRRPLVVLGAAL
jgi:hypothetical protein